jgi:hypothetical protein
VSKNGKMRAVNHENRNGGFTLGWQGINKLNAVEGIRLSRTSREMFAEFERLGTTAQERRRVIVARHSKKG